MKARPRRGRPALGMPTAGAVALLALFFGHASPAEEIQRGTLLTRELVGQAYYVYVPRAFLSGGAVLVSVHGASRGAEAHARAWMPVAERQNVVVVAPLFDFGTFPDYQRLNFRGPRADLRLHAILDEVARLTGADVSRFYLYGFSGGGQFVHRYSFVHPERLRRVAVGAPGWWVLPDGTLDYPYGIKKTSEVPADVEFRLDELLALPLAVVIGEKDTERDRSLRQDSLLDRLQGANRLERSRSWYARMRRLAEEKNIASQVELHVVHGVGHSGTHPDIIAQAAAFLFRRSESPGQN